LEASHGYLSVDGCFWHGCPLHASRPKTNAVFWRKNVAANHGHLTRADFLDPLFAFLIKLR
jgi:G:T-mismatch repair DNA endonuclease (very short patch repair protein)